MTSSQDNLLLAILSMDSYNRGYNAGIILSDDDAVGIAQIGVDSEVFSPGVPEENRIDRAADFYAISYSLGSETIISYRGTDNAELFDFDSDIWTGWGTGVGLNESTQVWLAAQFYQEITNTQTGAPRTGLVTLTGHGGLAGFVGAYVLVATDTLDRVAA